MNLPVYVPPLREHNITVNGTRVWSGDEWPPFGLLDTVMRIAQVTPKMVWSFTTREGQNISF